MGTVGGSYNIWGQGYGYECDSSRRTPRQSARREGSAGGSRLSRARKRPRAGRRDACLFRDFKDTVYPFFESYIFFLEYVFGLFLTV